MIYKVCIYKEFLPPELKADNIGFRMLKSMGWTEGKGLGSQGVGLWFIFCISNGLYFVI